MPKTKTIGNVKKIKTSNDPRLKDILKFLLLTDLGLGQPF